ncbi:SDR family NAD(P)-dependent oxidoreductase [Chryseobacterium sp. SNU WT5]|uniref:SDR family NAD(P)-dependent oxidoreductase n=1 Tax=Chryseobacterium sp. SNU WT5 TaxID=2594269 RepID=UPI00117FBD41|nr:SDR family NAD(P)-dependent oxidoreductase [Chryseobacterium sp. SNU WT5]QDP85571.1 SDR family NAD(P)-dependent oxidoreductase [Chryseobacterium sp. SNU WT5]
MKNILITGGSKGIGRDLVIKFHNLGHNVIFTYLNSEQSANELVDQLMLSNSRGTVTAIRCDTSSVDQVSSAVTLHKEFFKNLDVLVNNAGVKDSKNSKKAKPFLLTSYDEWWEVMHNNVNCVIVPTKRLLPFMIKNKRGRIINITSVSGIKGNPGQSAYAASKAAITNFSKSINKELSGLGIIVNCVAPSFIETEMTENIPDAYVTQRLQSTLLKRMGRVEEMSNLISYLAFEAPDFLINQEIVFDGGIG